MGLSVLPPSGESSDIAEKGESDTSAAPCRLGNPAMFPNALTKFLRFRANVPACWKTLPLGTSAAPAVILKPALSLSKGEAKNLQPALYRQRPEGEESHPTLPAARRGRSRRPPYTAGGGAGAWSCSSPKVFRPPFLLVLLTRFPLLL